MRFKLKDFQITAADALMARLETARAAEVLRQQFRPANRAVAVRDQAAVGLRGKQRLGARPDGERIRTAEQYDENGGEQEGSLEFDKEGFHGA